MPIKGTLNTAGPEHQFRLGKKHLGREPTPERALVLHPDWVDGGQCVVKPAPYVAYAHVSRIFDNHPPRRVGCMRKPW